MLGPTFIVVCTIIIHSLEECQNSMVHHRLPKMTSASSVVSNPHPIITFFSEHQISSDVVSLSGPGSSHRTHSIKSPRQLYPNGAYNNFLYNLDKK